MTVHALASTIEHNEDVIHSVNTSLTLFERHPSEGWDPVFLYMDSCLRRNDSDVVVGMSSQQKLESAKNKYYFIPGFGFNATIFPHDFACECLDLPSGETVDAMVHALASRLPEKITLFAWSLGGVVAIRLAELFPEKIQALILFASTPCFAEQSAWQGITKKTLTDFNEALLHEKDVFLQQFIRLVNYPNKNKGIVQSLALHGLHDEGVLTRQLSMLINTDVRSSYKKISRPILHVLGDKDAVLSVSIEQLHALNNHAEICVVENAGHALFLTHTAECVLRIKIFLSLFSEEEK